MTIRHSIRTRVEWEGPANYHYYMLGLRTPDRELFKRACDRIRTDETDGSYFEVCRINGRLTVYSHDMKVSPFYQRLGGILDAWSAGASVYPNEQPDELSSSTSIWKKHHQLWSELEIRRTLARIHLPTFLLKIFPGFESASLNRAVRKSFWRRMAAIVFIDIDDFESILVVLNSIRPQLKDGCILCFDGYDVPSGGAKGDASRALQKFTELYSEVSISPFPRPNGNGYGETGRAFVFWDQLKRPED